MNMPLANEVLDVAGAARFLRVRRPKVLALAEAGRLPGKKLDGEWRFLKAALADWLRGKPDYRMILIQQAGALADDDTLPELLASIYAARGRPEVEKED